MIRLWRRARELVLTVLIIVQTVWTFDECNTDTCRKLNASPNALDSNALTGESHVEIVIGTSADATTLQYYLSRWNESTGEAAASEDDGIYYGEGLQDVFFHSSAKNNSLILADLSRCMQDYVFVTCLKLLLIKQLDDLIEYVDDNNLTRTDFSFGNGLVSFRSVPGVNRYEGRASGGTALGLDEDITRKVMELFKDRSLNVNLLPGVGVDLKPVPGDTPGDFVGFRARPYLQLWHIDADPEEVEGRSGNKKRKKGGFQMPSMMVLPQLIMWGFMPFALANLQAMVMNAFMLNMMALNSAIFMTIRNLVFGPRGGPKIKYVNYGYRKKKKSSVPTIIVHSPAAFVKQPFHSIHRRKKPSHHNHRPHRGPPKPPPPHFHQNVPNEQVFYRDETPASFSEGFHDHGTGHGEAYDEYQTIDYGHSEFPAHHGFQNGVEVLKEDGKLDGKNRVRIRINENEGPSMKEVLHRIREIESYGQGFKPSAQYDYREVSQTGYSEAIPSGYDPSSADNTPWTVSDHSASHTFGDIHSPQSESEDYVISNDQNQFTPMRIYPKKSVGH